MVTDERILVTGGAGFIGSHLVDRLLRDEPAQATVVDDLSLGRLQNLRDASALRPDLRVEQADLSDLGEALSLLERVRPTIVFNLAVVPLPASLTDPRRTVAANVASCLNLCEGYRAGLFERLVHLSSSETYGSCVHAPMREDHPLNPTTPYAASKAAGDLLVRSYGETFGMPWLIVRPFNTYGPRQNASDHAGLVPVTVRRALRGEPVRVFGDGRQTRDYIYVRDTVDATAALARCDAAWGRVVNVGSGTEVSVLALIEEIGSALGRTIEVEFADARAADVTRHIADTSLLRALTGFEPGIDLHEGMRRTAEWYVQSLRNDSPAA